MRRIGAYEAKTHLPRLLDEVEAGETVTITKHGRPVAVLAPARPSRHPLPRRQRGFVCFGATITCAGSRSVSSSTRSETVIVIDASVALAWCLADEEDERRNALTSSSARAPAPATGRSRSPTRSLAAERRGRLTPDETDHARRLLSNLDVEIVPVELAMATSAVLDTARTLGLTAYDATYLDLARFRDVPLGTLDGDLIRSCATAGVPLAA
jgi:prevent-host-death family protein